MRQPEAEWLSRLREAFLPYFFAIGISFLVRKLGTVSYKRPLMAIRISMLTRRPMIPLG